MDASSLPRRPRLLASVRPGADGVEITYDGQSFLAEPGEGISPDQLAGLLERLDGTRSIEELLATADLGPEVVAGVVRSAHVAGMLADDAQPAVRHGLNVLYNLEHLMNTLFDRLVYGGRFWTELFHAPASVPERVYHGMALENYFFLYRENLFDSAVLTFPGSEKVRRELNEFYIEEHRHDEILLAAFESIGIGLDDLRDAMPLPTTMALVNALAWWARTDPLFFLATIGVLEGRLVDTDDGSGRRAAVSDSFIAGAEAKGLSPAFVEPIRRHARINAGHAHGAVSRELFAEVPGVDPATERRLRRHVPLFVELYAQFYDGIWDHYSDGANPLLRRVSREGAPR